MLGMIIMKNTVIKRTGVNMITLQEVDATGYPNHKYIVSDDRSKLHAYIIQSSGEEVKFSKPMPFSTRGRKFTEIGRAHV